MPTPRDIALIGCGAIARTQHAPFLLSPANDTGLRLVATADPRHTLPGFTGRHYPDHRALLAAEPEVVAISVTAPTALHYGIARDSLLADRHVLLEKPPATTLGEVIELQRIAAERGRVLVTGFHAQHNLAVERARELLAGRRPQRLRIEWREDFERWHPGQTWPWKPGGFGVFDPGINALSILCRLLPGLEFRVEHARFRIPQGAATPALAELRLAWEGGEGEAVFEWRRGGEDVWDITLEESEAGTLLIRSVRALLRNGEAVVPATPDREYAGIYQEFAAALDSGASQVSLREMRIIEDATMIAEVERSDLAF